MLSRLAGWSSLVLVGLYTFAISLPKGGRWDLYQALYMADTGIRYPDWQSGDFSPATPYFPGVAIVLRALSFAGSIPEIVALALAGALTSMVLLALALYSKHLGNSAPLGVLVTIYSVLALVFFNPWVGYSGEWKPDSLALIFFVFGVILITGKDIKMQIFASLPLYFSLITKQQIVAPYLALVLLLFIFALQRKQQAWSGLMVASLAAVFAALTILTIPGAAEFTIFAHAGRGFEFRFDIGYVRPLLGLMLIAILLRHTFVKSSASIPSARSLSDSTSRSQIAVPIGLAWLAAGAFGAINLGGNAGNLAVGALLMLPIIRWPHWGENYRIVAALTAVPVFLTSLQLIESPWLEYQRRHAEYASLASTLAQFKHSKILITPDSYLVVRSIGSDIQDLGTREHLLYGDQRTLAMPRLSEFLSKINPDTIVCVETCEKYFSPDDLRVVSKRYVQNGPKLMSKAVEKDSR